MFKKYSEIISCLLVAEQNNELLMKNHQSRLIGTGPFLKVNAISFKLMDMDVVMVVVGVMVVVVEGIIYTMELMVIILPIK